MMGTETEGSGCYTFRERTDCLLRCRCLRGEMNLGVREIKSSVWDILRWDNIQVRVPSRKLDMCFWSYGKSHGWRPFGVIKQVENVHVLGWVRSPRGISKVRDDKGTHTKPPAHHHSWSGGMADRESRLRRNCWRGRRKPRRARWPHG